MSSHRMLISSADCSHADELLSRMNPRVRDLYKRFLIVSVLTRPADCAYAYSKLGDLTHGCSIGCLQVGRDYPLGLSSVRDQAKKGFFAQSHLTTEADVNKAINVGRYYVREMIALIQLKKYRALRGRYEGSTNEDLKLYSPESSRPLE